MVNMADIDIQRLEWDDWNRRHIWDRHQLLPDDVEEVCYGDPANLYVQASYGGRYAVVGPQRGGKLFAVIFAPKGPSTFNPVSARRASTKERRLYRDWKAGKRP